MAPTRRRRDVAVFCLELLRVVGDVLERGSQVLEVEEQEAVVVGDLEDERKHAFLRVVELEDPREQERPHVRHGRPDRMTLLAEDVPHTAGHAA